MERNDFVSLWLGEATNQQSWHSILDHIVNEDGEVLGCDFSEEFELGSYDPDTFESIMYPKPRKSLKMLLHNFSYFERILNEYQNLGVRPKDTDNCVILIYNYLYNQNDKIIKWTEKGICLRFCGSVKYR